MVQRLHPKSRKGFNLIEAAIVLGVVGLIIGGIWWAASAVRERHNINRLVENAQLSCANAQRLFPAKAMAGVASSTWIPQQAQNAGMLAGDWASGTYCCVSEIKNLPYPTGGQLQVITSSTYWSGGIVMGIHPVTKTQCKQIMRAIVPWVTSNRGTSIYEIHVYAAGPTSTKFISGQTPSQSLDTYDGCDFTPEPAYRSIYWTCDNR